MKVTGCFRLLLIGLTTVVAFAARPAMAEDGHELWLRYRPIEPAWLERYAPAATAIVRHGQSPTLDAAAGELERGLSAMLGRPVAQVADIPEGAILLGTPASSPQIAALGLPLAELGAEGYLIRSARVEGHNVTLIAANGDIGLLYGAFGFLRLIQTGKPIDRLDILDRPRVERRMLNHWDDLDRSVERGYAGLSLWDWQTLPHFRDPRYAEYARANASLGINGTALNNVNSNADILTAPYLGKVAALADSFRPYGVRVYLSARFSAPIEIGGLPTADPLDPRVRAWWRAKADEIYRRIPDFGGFLVKANSEGQPGPQDYRRTHADGANMLAEALAPHGGIVIWRSFVYSAENPEDRIRQAFSEFTPLDGDFAANVIVQVKNGPLDFQPREPFSPLFGAMPETALGMELQITKEYLGFATHLTYLGTMWEEALSAPVGHRPGMAPAAPTVAQVIDGSLHGYRHTLVAGVANIGNARNWSGSQFDQANWYAFGRFAWNPAASAHEVAREWAQMTWGSDPALVDTVVTMMMGSREAVVDYMTPLGLTHLMATGHHYGPGPWVDDLPRADWNPVYYHRADAAGIGFDRTRSGSNAVAQYAPEIAAVLEDRARVPENLLLWFHRVKWDDRLRSGRTVWDELVFRYTAGVDAVRRMQRMWDGLAPKVDARRHAEVRDFLAIQLDEAQWWRDACIAYFQSISGRPLPPGHAPPAHDLEYYRAIRTPYAPGG